MTLDYSNSEEWIAYQKLMEERPLSFAASSLIPIETDIQKVSEFVKKTGKKIGVVYQSPYNMMVVDLVRDEKGGYYAYERIMPTVAKGAIVTVPLYQNQFVLMKQYRHSMRDYQYAFPRGYAEKNLSSAKNVAKEIQEELGGIAKDICYLGKVVADSGLCGNQVEVFSCEIEEVHLKQGYEGITKFHFLNQEEMKIWIREGKITDSFTLSAYSLYKVLKEL